MSQRPLVMVHGYAADGASFDAWRAVLGDAGYRDEQLHVVHYRSLSDDVGLADLAEGFERALSLRPGLRDDGPFDALVHSTGMLVVLSWLAGRPQRRRRLRRLIGLAPATFGSPLAHKGRGMLAALFRGHRRIGPDFLEAGDRILHALELGSRDTWALRSAFAPEADSRTRAFVFCGTDGYPFPMSLANTPGSDGTVRLAGCAPDPARVTLDLTRSGRRPRARLAPASSHVAPVVPIMGCHHGTIVSDPPEPLRRLVLGLLSSRGRRELAFWTGRARAHRDAVLASPDGPAPWQQLVFRVRDERGDPVPDYYLELLAADEDGRWRPAHDLRHPGQVAAHDVHVYAGDRSYRCFHLNLSRLPLDGRPVALRLIAHSGTDLVGYRGYRQRLRVDDGQEGGEPWDGIIELSPLARRAPLFRPLSTLLVEVRLDREPLPARGATRLVRFPAAARVPDEPARPERN